MKTIQRYLSFSNLLPTFIYISFLCIYVLGYDYKRKQQGFRKGTEALPCKGFCPFSKACGLEKDTTEGCGSSKAF